MIVGVIGSGAIGPDLAYGFLSALAKEQGSKVFLVDIKKEALDAGVARIKGYVQKAVARGKLSASGARALDAALVPTLELADLAACDYVLEAASEHLETKRAILARLESVVRPDCLIGFATSGLPRREIAAQAKHPDRCFVNHPFFPAWRALPIELVLSGESPAQRALGERMVATIRKLGKVPILTADVECFAADDVFCNYISEAARIVEEGLATPAQVDAVVHAAIGGGGPFNVMDLTKGNLLTVKCQKLMQHAKTGTPWFAPPALLETQGDKPWHDRKSAGPAAPLSRETAQLVLDRVLAVLFARSYALLEHKVCEPTETNWLTRMALGFRKGTLELAEELGGEKVRALCLAYEARNPGFPVPAMLREGRLPAFTKNVLVERGADGIATLRVFRPEVKNALSRATLQELGAAVQELEADASVRGIILTSFDGALAGADIQELAVLPDAAACRKTCLDAHPLLARLESCRKPLVAAVDGPVMGGGAELSMACHARVVGKQLQLAQPEVNLGIIPGYGGTMRLPRLLGVARALELLRTGRVASAAEAAEWGWAAGAPVEDAEAGGRALLAKVLAGEAKVAPVDPAPVELPAVLPKVDLGHRSLAIDKILVEVLREGLRKPLSEGLAVEAEGFARCKGTVDMDLGMKNFVQNGPRVPAAFLHE